MELWSNQIAELRMRNADCGLQIIVSNLQFPVSIRDPKSEISLAPAHQNTSRAGHEYYGIFEAISVE